MPDKESYIDYHDFVFKDGRLVGEFDAMYSRSSEVPWHQDKLSQSVYVQVGLQVLNYLEHPVQRVLEVGCGLGYITRQLAERFPEVHGIDISPQALEKARELVPAAGFFEQNLTQIPWSFDEGPYDLVVMKDVIWYILEKRVAIFSEIKRLMAEQASILVVQNFPALDQPFVGRDIYPDPAALAADLKTFWSPEYVLMQSQDPGRSTDQLLTFLGRTDTPGDIYQRAPRT